jgi:phosphonate transport system substrate-binding protein
MIIIKILQILLVAVVIPPGFATATTLTVGSISTNADKEIATFHPLAQYLAEQLKDAGVTQGRVVVARSIAEMAEHMKNRTVDLFFDSPYPVLAVSRLAGSQIMLRHWKRGQSDYHSLIVVRSDSPFKTIADLKGRMIAFEDPYSTSGYFLPKMTLLNAKLRLREYSSFGTSVAAGDTGFVFSRGKETTFLLVTRDKVAAGAVGQHDYESFRKVQPNAVRVIYESPSIPRSLLSQRKDLDATLVKRIREVLVAMEHSDHGRRILAAFENTTRFDDVPAEARRTLASLTRMMADADRETAQK